MSQHSVIEHRANYHFLKLEEDYIAICEGKHRHCKAAILSLLEHWMNSKRGETSNDDDLFIYMSYPQFVKHLFNLYGRSMVIICLEELEQETLIMKRPYIDAFNQDTFEYRLNRPVIQAKLNALPELPSKSIIGSSKVNEGSSKINYPHSKVNEGSSENKRGSSLKVNEGSFKSKRNIDSTQIPNIDTTQIDREERESPPNIPATTAIVSSDTAHAVSSSGEIPVTFAECLSYLQEQGVAACGEDAVQVMVQARTLYAHKHPRYAYRALPGLSEHPDDQLPSQQNEELFTNEPQGDDHATAASGHRDRMGEPAAPGVDGAGSPSQDKPLATPEARPVLEAQEEVARTPPTTTPAQSLSLPQAEQAALGAKQGTKKAKSESPAPKCDTKEIQRRINENRGYALEEDVEIIRERKAIKTWCNLHTLSDFDPVMKYLTTVDLYWRKPENRNRIGGLTLLKETSRVKSELEKGDRHRKSPNGIITVLPPNGRDLAARSRALREQYAGVSS